MGFINKIKNRGKSNSNESSKEENKIFEHLEVLINSGQKDIVLDSGFVLGNKQFQQGIEIYNDGLTIDGNDHTVDAKSFSSIFKVMGENITIKNLTFKNARSVEGGAILNMGNLTLENCRFESNNASNLGGAIANFGTLKLEKCIFISNNASKGGGAIYNHSTLKMYNCSFEENFSYLGGALGNGNYQTQKAYVYAFNCEFKKNIGNLGGVASIANDGTLELIQCDFIDNNAFVIPDILQFSSHCTLTIDKSNFSYSPKESRFGKVLSRVVDEVSTSQFSGTIHILKGEAIINSSEFYSTNDEKNVYMIYNEEGNLKVNDSIFDVTDGKEIYQSYNYDNQFKELIKKEEDVDLNAKKEGLIKEKSSEQFKEGVKKEKRVSIEESSSKYSFGEKFSILNELIENGCNEISLDKDYSLNNIEEPFFNGGIELTHDDMIIDGNNCTISANELSRIFYITGKNITLKNIRFKSGKFRFNYLNIETDGGGVLYIAHDASVRLINCKFFNNTSNVSGGVINNKGKIIEITNCEFRFNESEKLGGAIINNGIICNINKSTFLENKTKSNSPNPLLKYNCKGGAIYNNAHSIILMDCSFRNNHSANGGAIYNNLSSLKCMDCSFKNNQSDNGGALFGDNGTTIDLENCKFKGNSCEEEGGAIYYKGILNLKECKFKNNNEDNSKVINRDSIEGMINL